MGMAANEPVKKRVAWLDIAKGIGIALVLLGHSMRDDMRMSSAVLDGIYRVVYIFHMSFFFWLSGYVYRLTGQRRQTVRRFLSRKLYKWALPFAGYTLLVYSLFALAVRMPGVGGVLRLAGYGGISLPDYLTRVLQANNPYAYHLWFIYVLFLIELLFFFLDRATRRLGTDRLCFVVILAAALLLFAQHYADLREWWRLAQYLSMYMVFFALGVWMQDKTFRPGLIRLWGCGGLVYTLVRARFFSGFSGNSIQADSFLLTMLIRYLAFLLLPGLMLWICLVSKREGGSFTGRVREGLAALGRNSFVIYLFHQPFCCAFLGMVLYNTLHLPALACMAACIGVSLCAAPAWSVAARLAKGRGHARSDGTGGN